MRKPWDDSIDYGNNTTPVDSSRSVNLSTTHKHAADSLLELEATWKKSSIPEEFRQIYRECILDSEFLDSEIHQLRRGRSAIQKALKSVLVREDSLASIQAMNSKLAERPNQPISSDLKVECAELLHTHRILTLGVVENIAKWKQQMLRLGKKVEFYWKGTDYLKKVREDLQHATEFARIFQISPKPDPFLISPSKGYKPKGTSYFLDGDTAFIPLPSILNNRIDIAEKLLFEEDKPKLISLNSKRPMQKSLVINHSEIAMNYIEELIEIQLLVLVPDLANELIQESVYEHILHKEIEACATEFTDTNENSVDRAQQLRDFQLFESIYRVLVEEMLEECNLEEIAGSFLTRSIERRKTTVSNLGEAARLAARELEIENEHISELLSKEVIDDFLDEFWIWELCEFMLSRETVRRKTIPPINLELEPEDNAIEIFTPNVHSPVEYSMAIESGNVEFPLGIDLDVDKLDGISFVPIKTSIQQFPDVVRDYVECIPNEIQKISADLRSVQAEITKGNDPCCYWGILDNKIFGLIVYYVDPFSVERKVILAHISCLNFKLYKDFLKENLSFLWAFDRCQEIRVHLFHPVLEEINRSIKNIFNELKFRWKSEHFISSTQQKLTVMGVRRSTNVETFQPPICVTIKSLTDIVDEDIENQSSEGKPKIGLRQSMVSCLLKVFEQQGQSEGSNLLQNELSSLLHRFNEDQFSEFPFTSAVWDSRQNQASSAFKIETNLVSCTNVTHYYGNKLFKFMRLQKVVDKTSGEYHIYIVSTNFEHISAFFLRKRDLVDYSDLYLKVKQIFEVCQEQRDALPILVPAFNLNLQDEVSWVHGFNLGNGKSVKSYSESLEISMNMVNQSEGIFVSEVDYENILEEDLVFGLIESRGEKVSDLPIFVCLVEWENWIPSFQS